MVAFKHQHAKKEKHKKNHSETVKKESFNHGLETAKKNTATFQAFQSMAWNRTLF
jgi:hypothetical protein